jgi:predicted Zn finger-like uncharacterized protein
MIIQCKQCRTKFRFDDSFMQGSGVWLRCSRCGHVYFQENPKAQRAVPDFSPDPEQDMKFEQEPERDIHSGQEPEQIISEKQALPEKEEISTREETPSVFHRDENGRRSLDKILAARKRGGEDIAPGVEQTPDEDFAPVFEQTEKPVKVEEFEKIEESENIFAPERKKRSAAGGSGKSWKVALWSFLVIVLIPLVIYFFIMPQYGDRLIGSSELLVKKFNEYRGVSEPVTTGPFINQMVRLSNIRYRRIDNYMLGKIGVLEGTAVNSADYSLSRVRIKGEIVNVYSVALGESASYAGNILTDEELVNLSEEEIFTMLLRPEGLNNVNDKIAPGGRIPFMIIFTNEPAGVIKTTAVTIGAERLLSD